MSSIFVRLAGPSGLATLYFAVATCSAIFLGWSTRRFVDRPHRWTGIALIVIVGILEIAGEVKAIATDRAVAPLSGLTIPSPHPLR
jgi:hypothetical protein